MNAKPVMGLIVGLAMLSAGLCPVSAEPEPPAPADVAVEATPLDITRQDLSVTRQMVPYVGIVTAGTSADTAAQLNLPDGVGLTVRHVAEGSPAAEKGVRPHDVLHMLNDQLLITPEQFRVLVRMVKPGDELTLRLFRGGQPVEVTLTVDQHETATVRFEPDMAKRMLFGPAGVQVDPVTPEAQRALAQQRINELRVHLDRLKADLAQNRKMRDDERERIREILEGLQLDDGFDPAAVNGGAPRAPGFSSHFVRMADNDHVIEVRTTNGSKILKATDRAGKVLFEGPIDTDEQRAAVPAEILAKAEKLENRASVEIQIQRMPPAQPETQDQHMFN